MSERAAAVIRVTRDKTRSQDRRRAYAVVVDQDEAGQVDRGQTTDVTVHPGWHVVRLSVDFEHSREWSVGVSGGDVVHFRCRSRGKKPSDPWIDLYLADPADQRATLVPPPPDAGRDLALKQRAVTRGGQRVHVWAHRSGYLRSFDPGAGSGDGDSFLLEMAIYIVVIPVLCVLRWVRHRLLFKRGWSVGVLRDRRFLWPRKVRLERCPDEARARARAAEVLAEVDGWSGA